MASSEETWELYDYLVNELGEAELLEGIARAMGTDRLSEELGYVARMHGIDPEEVTS